MAERSQKVVVLDGVVSAYTSRWGGCTCYQNLIEGPEWVLDEMSNAVQVDDEDSEDNDCDRIEWYSYVDGGYLVDFDRTTVLVKSSDKEALNAHLPVLMEAWPDWTFQVSADVPEEFHLYLESVGILRTFDNLALNFRGDIIEIMLTGCSLDQFRFEVGEATSDSLQFVQDALKLCSWLPFQPKEQRTDHPTIDIDLLLDPSHRDRIIQDGLRALRQKPVFHWLEPFVRTGEIPPNYEVPKKITLGLVVAIASTGELRHLYVK